MPFTSPDPNYKAFSVKKLTDDDIRALLDLRYPADDQQEPTKLADIAVYILNTYDMQISVANLHTFLKKKRLSTRIKNSKAALKEIELSKIVNQSTIDKVIENVGGLLLDIAQEKESPASYSTVVNAMVKWKEAVLKERELELKERVQAEGGMRINVNSTGTPSREVLDQLSREIGLL